MGYKTPPLLIIKGKCTAIHIKGKCTAIHRGNLGRDDNTDWVFSAPKSDLLSHLQVRWTSDWQQVFFWTCRDFKKTKNGEIYLYCITTLGVLFFFFLVAYTLMWQIRSHCVTNTPIQIKRNYEEHSSLFIFVFSQDSHNFHERFLIGIYWNVWMLGKPCR